MPGETLFSPIRAAHIGSHAVCSRSWAAGEGTDRQRDGSMCARAPQRRGAAVQPERGPRRSNACYRTHWISPSADREPSASASTEKASRAPELVVIQPLNDWTCHRCGGTGDLLIMETAGPTCLRCVGLDDLEFLPGGNALLTRRAKAKNARHAVVVRFSKKPPSLRARGPAGRTTVPGRGSPRPHLFDKPRPSNRDKR